MASKVRAQLVNEDIEAAFKLEGFQVRRLCSPVREVVKPTTPAMRENTMKNPVAIFPIGKYIGNILAGVDRTEAAFHKSQP